ncbi:hypothetical protein HDU93_001569, partial [Gonapodya sp. JEL0774]
MLHIAVKAGMEKLRIEDINEEKLASAEDVEPGALKKLYQVIFKIRQSPQLREKYAAQFTDRSKPARELVAPVETRWQSDFDAITRALADCPQLEIGKDFKELEVVGRGVGNIGGNNEPFAPLHPAFKLGWMQEEGWEEDGHLDQ